MLRLWQFFYPSQATVYTVEADICVYNEFTAGAPCVGSGAVSK